MVRLGRFWLRFAFVNAVGLSLASGFGDEEIEKAGSGKPNILIQGDDDIG